MPRQRTALLASATNVPLTSSLPASFEAVEPSPPITIPDQPQQPRTERTRALRSTRQESVLSRCTPTGPPHEFEPLMTGAQVEDMLQLGRGWCAKDRITNALIPFVKIQRSVRYRRADVEEFVRRSLRRSTSDTASSGNLRVRNSSSEAE